MPLSPADLRPKKSKPPKKPKREPIEAVRARKRAEYEAREAAKHQSRLFKQQLAREKSAPPPVPEPSTKPPDNPFMITPDEKARQMVEAGSLSIGTKQYDIEKTIAFICDTLETGRPLNLILQDNAGMPKRKTLDEWCDDDPELSSRLKASMEIGFDYLAAECLEIADLKPMDTTDVQHQRLRVDTRLKLLSKWFPKKYGESMQIQGDITHRVSPLEQLRQMRPDSLLPSPLPRAGLPPAVIDVVEAGVDTPGVSEEDCF